MKVGQCPNMAAPLADPKAVHQALAASGARRTAGTGASTQGFHPDGVGFHSDDATFLFDHCNMTPEPERIDRATRSAVPSGISPITVTSRSPWSVARRRDTAAVGPSWLRWSMLSP